MSPNQPPQNPPPSEPSKPLLQVKPDLQTRLSSQIHSTRELISDLPIATRDSCYDEAPLYCVSGRRLLAFIIDGFFIYGIGLLINALSGIWLLQHFGEDGWWVGLSITGIYFGLIDSSLTEGKGFGKRLMKIEVRATDGKCLNPIIALLRFLPIAAVGAVVFFVRFRNPYEPLTWGICLAGILLALGLATFAVAHPQRRSLHDLLVGSVVVRSGIMFRLEKCSVQEPIIVFATLAVLIIIAIVPAKLVMGKNPMVQKQSKAYETLGKRTDIDSPKITTALSLGENWIPQLTTIVSVHVKNALTIYNDRSSTLLARSIASDLKSARVIPDKIRTLTVGLRSGYDIGIYRNMNQNIQRVSIGGPMPLGQTSNSPTIQYKYTPGSSRLKQHLQKEAAKKGDTKGAKQSAPTKSR